MLKLSSSKNREHNTLVLGLAFSGILATFVGLPSVAETIDPGDVVASDQASSTTTDAEEVAREVLRLQEEMGGSIVSDFAKSNHARHSGWPFPAASPTTPPQPGWHAPLPNPVEALQQATWQLEQSAHLLELLDLYDQADALRSSAARIRLEARKMKSLRKPADSATARENSIRN